MNGMLGMLQLMEFTDLTEEQQDYLVNAKAASALLLDVINDVLVYSKIEAGKIQLKDEPFEIHQLLEEVARFFRPLTDNQGIHLTVQAGDPIPRQLRGDAFRLKQVLHNLVGNALKFTEKGSITVQVTAEQDLGDLVELKFRVTDTGIGIQPEQIHTLFERFSQADSSHTRQRGGTGLGLAICRGIVEKMQGQIWVESEWGKGSTFAFTCRFQKLPSGE